jgi:hypothetical protein
VRQAKVMGFETPTAYLLQALAATLAGNEADTYINDLGGSRAVARSIDRNAVKIPIVRQRPRSYG